MSRFARFFRDRPALRDAILWALPALVCGLLLRVWLCAASPYAYWGSDSSSYYAFAYRLFEEGNWIMPEKREYVYPYLLALITVLPGVPLKWLLLFQHGLGLLTLIPLAYCVRKICTTWCWLVIPVTLLYALMPVILWYEHELLGEAFFSAMVVWAMAGWFVWHTRRMENRQRAWDWWFFLVPMGLCVMTKPSGQFFWPGLLLGIAWVAGWRSFTWKEWVGTAAVLYGAFTLGESSQGSRLLYSSVFPLTRLESGAHPELKREIAPLVRQHRREFDVYLHNDGEVKRWLRNGFKGQPGFETWQALYNDRARRAEYAGAMRTLALEAIRDEPVLCLQQIAARALASVNPSEFKARRFRPEFAAERHEEADEKEEDENSTDVKMMKLAYGMPLQGPGSESALIATRLRAESNEARAEQVAHFVDVFNAHSDFLKWPTAEKPKQPTLHDMRPTWLGWLLIAGGVLSLISFSYRSTAGVWLIVALSYVGGVYLVGGANARFFLPVWPVIFVLLALPFDYFLRCIPQLRSPRA